MWKSEIPIFSFVELVFKKQVVNIGIKLYNKLQSQTRKLENMQPFRREVGFFL